MLLEQALSSAECPICLQNLGIGAAATSEDDEGVSRSARKAKQPVLVDESTAHAERVINVDEPEASAQASQPPEVVTSTPQENNETTAAQLMRLLVAASGQMTNTTTATTTTTTMRGDFMTAQHIHALMRESDAELHPDMASLYSDAITNRVTGYSYTVPGIYTNGYDATNNTSISNNKPNAEAKTTLLSESQVEQGGAAVLMCGHLMHYLCALQLYEYTQNASCPVCRTHIKSRDEIIRFTPRTSHVVTQQQQSDHAVHDASSSSTSAQSALSSSSHVAVKAEEGGVEEEEEEEQQNKKVHDEAAEHNTGSLLQARHHRHGSKRARSPEAGPSPPVAPDAPSLVQHTRSAIHHPTSTAAVADSEAAEDATKDEIVLIGSRRRSPSHVYRDRLLRRARQYHARAENLSERETHLQQSLTQLEEECRELAGSVAAARQRYEVMSAHGSLERLAELRQLCRETQHSCDCATAELAAATRESAELKAQIDKYAYKIQRLQ